MDVWKILVLGVLKQGLRCDQLHELANQHKAVRQGHLRTIHEYQTVLDNISLLTPELLSEVQNLVVKTGHEVAKKTLASPSRCDSFVVETDVHYRSQFVMGAL